MYGVWTPGINNLLYENEVVWRTFMLNRRCTLRGSRLLRRHGRSFSQEPKNVVTSSHAVLSIFNWFNFICLLRVFARTSMKSSSELCFRCPHSYATTKYQIENNHICLRVYCAFCIIPSHPEIPPNAKRLWTCSPTQPLLFCAGFRSPGSLRKEINQRHRMPNLLKYISGREKGFYNYRLAGMFYTWHQTRQRIRDKHECMCVWCLYWPIILLKPICSLNLNSLNKGFRFLIFLILSWWFIG